MNATYIRDLTTGREKTFEVIAFATDSLDELPTYYAKKIISKDLAFVIANWVLKYIAGWPL